MGRRAKKAPVQTKKRATLAKRFKCPFCANQNSVECKMDNRNGLGSLNCRICDASFQMPIHHLHEPIDVFSEWLDSCEAAERGEETTEGGGGGGGALDEGHGNTNTIHSTSGFVQDSDDDDDGLGFGSGLDRTSKSSSSSAKGQKGSSAGDDGGNQQSYSALGLDDSDDDSD